MLEFWYVVRYHLMKSIDDYRQKLVFERFVPKIVQDENGRQEMKKKSDELDLDSNDYYDRVD